MNNTIYEGFKEVGGLVVTNAFTQVTYNMNTLYWTKREEGNQRTNALICACEKHHTPMAEVSADCLEINKRYI